MLKKDSTQLTDYLKAGKPAESIILTISKITAELSKIIDHNIIKEATAQINSRKPKLESSFEKLRIQANELFIDMLSENAHVYSILSSELDGNYVVNEDGDSIVTIDPLHGGNNLDSSLPLGAIFSVLDRSKNILQPGKFILASGYILFATNTILVFSTGGKVEGFTLAENGQFVITNPGMRVKQGTSYTIDESNTPDYPDYINSFLSRIKADEEGAQINSTYTQCIAADLHKIFINGGILLYPEYKDSDKTGLKLIYQVNPIVFLARAGGGRSYSKGREPLQIQPDELHQIVPIVTGSTSLVDMYFEEWEKSSRKSVVESQ